MIISIANQYSRFPAGRYPADGPFNASRFREELLLPAIDEAAKTGARVIVKLDGVMGYSSSFLEEVFGGAARARRDLGARLKNLIAVAADDVAYESAKLDAEKYLSDAISRK